MKYIVLLFLVTGIGVGLRGQNPQITSATVTFTFVKKEVTGTISGFSSTSTIDWNDLEGSSIAGQVQTETLKTGNFIRDWSLKSSKYFDVDTFPTISFKSDRIVPEGNDFLVYGSLSLKGISKPIIIAFKKAEKKLTGTTTLYTPDFDITILKSAREDNKVNVTLDLTLE